MSTTERTFQGSFITSPETASLKPNHVFHKQLDREAEKNFDLSVSNRHILFRKEIIVDAEDIKNAKAFITADDFYKLYINGSFVAQGPAAGYHFNYFYNEIPIGEFLREGKNTIAVHTYYQGLINRVWVSGDNRHGLILDVVSGDKTLVCSDTSFKCATHSGYSSIGIAGYKTQFLESYNTNAPEVGFEKDNFDDSDWVNAVPHPLSDDYTLVPQPSKPVITEDIPPVSVIRLDNGGLRIDFGAIFVGTLYFTAKGEANDKLTLYFGQELNDDGSVRHKMRCNCDYIGEMILSGKEDSLREFDYKSFRYAEIIPEGNARVEISDIKLIARHYPFELRAKPSFTDSSLEPIWNLCVDSFRYGVQEQIMDCMDREKGYYLGDGCYTMFTYGLLTKDWTLSRKFIKDFLRTTFVDRGLLTCGNCSKMQEIAEYPFMLILFAWLFLQESGDKDFIDSVYNQFADILDCYKERYALEDGLIANLDKWSVVEWPKNYQDNYDADISEGKVCTAIHNAINAYYIGAVKSLNEIAKLIGRPPYADAELLENAFRKAFYDSERHLFKDAVGSTHISLPANTYAAFFQLQDDPLFMDSYIALLREKCFSSVNMFQIFPVLCQLFRDGYSALAHEIISSDETWKRIIREGGTRSFEGWGRDTKWNTSLFHLTLACGAAFLCDWNPAKATAFGE